MDAPHLVGESATTAITNHMVHLAREGRAEHIRFFLALRATETQFLPKTFKDVAVMPQANFPQKITFDTLYTNGFSIRICSRTLSISSEHNTI